MDVGEKAGAAAGSIFERGIFKIRSNKANYYAVNSSFFRHRAATSPITPQYQHATICVDLNVHGNGGKAPPIIDIGTGSWVIKFMFLLLNLAERPQHLDKTLPQSPFGYKSS
jgi:hypothetical protein